MIVRDASAAAAGLVRDGPARLLMAQERTQAPHLIDAEVAHAVCRLALTGQVSAEAAQACLDAWSSFSLTRRATWPFLGRIWELKSNISAYGGSYVALAESLECALITADQRLGKAADSARCLISIVPR